MNSVSLSAADSKFLSYLRSFSIFIIVFGHVGGFWVYPPFSEFLHVFVPVFFFISGAVSYLSFKRSPVLSKYYLKRFIGLLVPYYLLCLLVLLAYVMSTGAMPLFDFANLIKWLQIRPSDDLMMFPLGQVWFLHTLFIITLLSPIYFILVRQPLLLIALLILFISISTVQFFVDIDDLFIIEGNNLFKPIIHSIFYILGAMFVAWNLFSATRINSAVMIVSVSLCLALVWLFNPKLGYAHHTYAPDIYYVLGSLAAITAFVLARAVLVRVISNSSVLRLGFEFFHRHTFSIFLLHSLSIYLAERLLGLENAASHAVAYGLLKLVVVLLFTCLISVPFSALCVRVSVLLLGFLGDRKKT